MGKSTVGQASRLSKKDRQSRVSRDRPHQDLFSFALFSWQWV